MPALALATYVGFPLPSLLMKRNPFVPRRIVARSARITEILRLSALTQVGPSIVALVTIAVINPAYVLAGHVDPYEMVRQITNPINSNLTISSRMPATSNRTLFGTPFIYTPPQRPALRIIGKKTA